MEGSKNDVLVFNKFQRKYKEALKKLQIDGLISVGQVHNILGFLGYIDQYVNEQTLQLSHTITYLLSQNKDSFTTKKNLFEFLRVITDIKKFHSDEYSQQTKPLAKDLNGENKCLNGQYKSLIGERKEPLVCLRMGHFTSKGQWVVSDQEEVQVKKVFGFMNLKRISRQKVEAQQRDYSQFFQEETFKPSILQKSKQIAKLKYKKVSLSHSKVQQRLLASHSQHKNKLQEQARRSVQKEMKECRFRPQINPKSVSMVNNSLCKYVDSFNTSFENKQNDISLQNINKENMHKSFSQKSEVGNKKVKNRTSSNINNLSNSNIYLSNNRLDNSQSAHTDSRSILSNVGDKLLNKGKQYEQNLMRLKQNYNHIKQEQIRKQCTFHPKINQKPYLNPNFLSSNSRHLQLNNTSQQSQYQGSKQCQTNKSKQTNSKPKNNQSVNVRNADKSIQRMKEARKKRQFQNQVKQRGYPQNIAWTKFMASKKVQSDRKSPILCIDLKIMDCTRNIKVYEGQSLQGITQSICVENNVPHQFWFRLQSVLKSNIQSCGQVKIENNRIYLNR